MAKKAPAKGSGKPIPKPPIAEYKKEFTPKHHKELLGTLKARFEENMTRHQDFEWDKIQAKLEKNTDKLQSLNLMERTGGEPDVVGYIKDTDEYLFYDCSVESPAGRRSICYDRKGEEIREKKGVFPAGNAIDMAAAIGIELLTEDQYRDLQELGNFDTKTSSWIVTPPKIRKLGGAIFCDRRFDTVFVFHNGADSFYSARGFRGLIKV